MRPKIEITVGREGVEDVSAIVCSAQEQAAAAGLMQKIAPAVQQLHEQIREATRGLRER